MQMTKQSVEEKSTILLSAEDGFARLSQAELRRMREAGALVADVLRIMNKTGDNVVGEVLRGAGTFTEWNHYPDGDVFDPESHAQYYYHAHPPANRVMAEHGHFHLFLRDAGMPEGVRPVDGQNFPSGHNPGLCHLVAISMDEYGYPIRLFTTNRWVCGDVWYPADDVSRMLDSFRMDVVRPNLAVSRWITAMVDLFRPQIISLLHARDKAVESWDRLNPSDDIFEDRRFEIPSMMEISIGGQINLLDNKLGDRPDDISAL